MHRTPIIRPLPRVLPAGILAALAFTLGCGEHTPPDTGSVEVSVSALLADDVVEVTTTITGSALPNPKTVRLATRADATWGSVIGGLPVGDNYTFAADAKDGAGTVLFHGAASGIAILKDRVANVLITAQQVGAPPAYQNSVPVIDSLFVSTRTVEPGATLTAKATAHDADGADSITFAWSTIPATDAFSAPTAASTTWTAPSTPGDYALTIVVKDNRGASTSGSTTVHVVAGSGKGQANTTVGLNTWPVVADLAAAPGILAPGTPATLTATASDVDQDALTYAWTSSCALGTFGSPTATTTTFTLPTTTTETNCRIDLTVSDGRGGVGAGQIVLPVGATEVTFGPEIVDSLQSTDTADLGGGVTLQISASDPKGGPLAFAWSATSGVIGGQIDTAGTSQIQWTAPRTFSAEWTITVVATNGAGASATASFGVRAAGRWMTADLHQHTYFTDGSYPMNDLVAAGEIAPAAVADTSTLHQKGVMPQGFRFGLDVQANSEHGGIRNRDGFGKAWNTYSPSPVLGDGASATQTNMWRWQSLLRASDIPGYAGPAYMGAYDWLLGIRAAYPQKLALTGMEWNPPGHEHSTTGIVSADARPIAEFEYRFDKSDTDGAAGDSTATTMGWTGKKQNNAYTFPDFSTVLALNAQHEKTMDAVRWMQANHPTTGWIIPAHVERAGCGVGAWSIAAFRDMNDAGPQVAFGFEGIPGHETGGNRGEFGAGACGGGTYGGAGSYIATVGGLWDNLLADGRAFFNFASSDFHNDQGSDFWPGEYLKTYVKVKDRNGDGAFDQEEFVAGYRSGNVYSVHGDLINDLDFRAIRGATSATMGETLRAKAGESVTVVIRFKSPAANNCKAGVNASASYTCQPPAVHHVQLIQGRINSARAGKFLADGTTPNPAFNAIDATVASVAKTFDATSWTTDADGFTTMSFTVSNIQTSQFFRVRGANLGYGVKKMDRTGTKIVYGTDDAGNPLINTPGTNSADMAWDDLWFYGNPIFVKID